MHANGRAGASWARAWIAPTVALWATLAAALPVSSCMEPRRHALTGTGAGSQDAATATGGAAGGGTGGDAPSATGESDKVGSGGDGGAGRVGTGGAGTGGSATGAAPTGGSPGVGGGLGLTGGAPGSGGSPACAPACGSGATCNADTCVCATEGQTYCPDGCFDLQSDKDHCGSCTATCPSGCTTGRCYVPLATTGSDENHIAVNADKVFFTSASAGTVAWVSRTGGGARVIAASQASPSAIAVASSNVYWVNRGFGKAGGTVMKMILPGGTPIALANAEDYPHDIAVDGEYVYWDTFVPGGTIAKVPIDGGGKVTLATVDTMTSPFAMTIDGANVYWTSHGSDTNTGSVMKVPLAGGTITTLASGYDLPSAIAVGNGAVFFMSHGPDGATLKKVGINGGAVSTVLADVWVQALASDATNLYLAKSRPRFGTTIVVMPFSSAATKVMAELDGAVSQLAVDATTLFWSWETGIASTLKVP